MSDGEGRSVRACRVRLISRVPRQHVDLEYRGSAFLVGAPDRTLIRRTKHREHDNALSRDVTAPEVCLASETDVDRFEIQAFGRRSDRSIVRLR